MGLHHECAMLLWSFDIYMDTVVTEVNAIMLSIGWSIMNVNGREWNLNPMVFAVYIALVYDFREVEATGKRIWKCV